jgi:protocatechuate 3,4-dioxygenase beta subunit
MSRRILALAIAAASLGALAVGGGAASAACPGSNLPNELVVAAGSSQTTQLGRQFPTALQVQLANTNGCAVTGDLGGITVTFVAPAGGASGTFASSASNVAYVGTNAQGIATAPAFTANGTGGSYGVYAESDYGAVRLNLANTAAGLAASIAAGATTALEATVSSRYAEPLQARVTDANGNPVQGATVTFTVVAGATGAGASFLGGQATATTGADGVATSPPLLANASPGPFGAVATVDGVAVAAAYTLDNHAATETIAATRTRATAAVDGRFAPLEARVLDADGQPVEGASVTFSIAAAAGGAGASFTGGGTQATELTGVDGTATSPGLHANTAAGAFTATATTSGARPVVYALRNRAGTPHTIAAGAASGESTQAGSRFPIRLAVTVQDRYGNPVAGAVVAFRAPKHGPSGHFTKQGRRLAKVKTNADGIAVAPPFTADRRPGGYVVTATAGGKRVAFALIGLAA